LRLYLCSTISSFGFADPQAFAQELATLLQMKVFVFMLPIVFRPHLQTNPLDEIRGRVSLSLTDPIVQDVHQLDLQMLEFS
jgi:hypothetical protein